MIEDTVEEVSEVAEVKENITEKSALKKKLSTRARKLLIKSFKKNGDSFLQKLNENQVENIVVFADEQYYNKNKPVMTDEEYDVLREWAVEKFPDNETLNQGHEGINLIACKEKVKLPYFLGSMDKIKPDTKVLNNWLKKYKNQFVISAKLDGMSALYLNEDGVDKMFTRGCGNYGFDISHLIPYVKVPKINEKVVRGELIISKKEFQKFSKEYSNERSFAVQWSMGKI